MKATYPTIEERQRAVAVSSAADFVRINLQNCHVNFIGHSVFAQEMYKHKIKKDFDILTSVWEQETLFSSNFSEIINNSAYRSIISLGEDVIPFIIEDLKHDDKLWFYALELLTGQNPIKENHRGIIPLMKQDWIDWAYKNDILNEA